VAEDFDVQVTILRTLVTESGFVEASIAALRADASYYHSEGGGVAGHAPVHHSGCAGVERVAVEHEPGRGLTR